MFTTIDKAIAALLGGVAFLLNSYMGIGIPEEVVAGLVPVLVWLVPNREV